MSPAVIAGPAQADLERAQRDLVELEGELQTLEAARRERQADLNAARRDKAALEVAAKIGGELATLERIIADQRKDTNEARATVARLQAEGVRAERVAALRSTYDDLRDVRGRYTTALIVAIDSVVAAFEPVRALRDEWLEVRSRAREDVEALGLAVNLRFGTQEEKRPTLAALEALHLDANVLFEAPDNAAPRAFEHFEREAHFRVPSHLAARARVLGPRGQREDVTVQTLFDVARAVLNDPLRDTEPA